MSFSCYFLFVSVLDSSPTSMLSLEVAPTTVAHKTLINHFLSLPVYLAFALDLNNVKLAPQMSSSEVIVPRQRDTYGIDCST